MYNATFNVIVAYNVHCEHDVHCVGYLWFEVILFDHILLFKWKSAQYTETYIRQMKVSNRTCEDDQKFEMMPDPVSRFVFPFLP